ncbi:TRAP transporter, 4TM/12TM fusion protein [Roseovarius pacificus]|uniref:TRAP transporter, 4TM/12TM fusion protein n=1 Tax=Roseovarius pacificus TaxID=337701 RepID=A0A1M7GVW1_9RHOB|nr:TRAP transporter fused permease subunit [Roseovarius pacificus]GGO60159.1 C4-dicarboxylate ABC transporter [Roseovarius pacificus]SHM20502.1 TRAP transporter, 4TM/12TM fusion protein [Roseovarius pacificus]
MRHVAIAASILLAAFHFWTATSGVFESFTQRNTHLLLVLAATTAFVLSRDRQAGDLRHKIMAVASVMLSISLIYNLVNADFFANRMAYVTPLDGLSIVMALLGMAGLLAVAILMMGWAFGLIIVVFLIYVALGQVLPGAFGHRGFGLSWIVDHLYYTKEGVFGIPLGVSATYIFLFVFFGALLDRCGGGKFLIDLALAMTGRLRGGPAKAAIVGSAMMGTISGSAVANVVTTGAITIPLMKRNGYRPHFAAAVEAAASSGGQLMPPVMGATAFVIAEFVGRPYQDIAVSAVVPAFLFYLGIFCAVHFEAVRQGITRSGERIEGGLWTGVLYLVPIGVVAAAVFAFSPMRAGVLGSVSVLVVAASYMLFRGEIVQLPRRILEGIEAAARAMGPVAVACAASGMIVGVLSLTGLGLTLNNAILHLAGQSLWAALVLTMLSSLILGMGLPTVAAYLVQAGVTIPALVSLGVAPIPAHLFVFYFAILGNVTPPVAVAAYAAGGVAQADPARTGWTALAISVPAFIVPYMFVLDPALVLQGGWLEILVSVATAIVGVVALAGAIVGSLWRRIAFASRLPLAAGALLMLIPGISTDVVGAVLILIGIGFAASRPAFNAIETTSEERENAP